MIFGIHEYITILTKFGYFMVRPGGLHQIFANVKCQKKIMLFPAIQNTVSPDFEVFLE
jgi:hypothetical protein